MARLMSKFAIRLLTLIIFATALLLVPIVTPAKAATSSSGHMKKHHKPRSLGTSDPRFAGRAWRFTRPSSQTGAACSRGFECETWPPPMYEDPQRNPDGGGM
jgi:hypothetical protein